MGWDNSGPAATGDFSADSTGADFSAHNDEENNISKHANGDFEAGGGAGDEVCRK